MTRTARTVLAVAVAAGLLAVSGRLDLPVPGSPVPQSAQTLVVLAAGLALGPRLGGLTVLLVLLAAAVGAPVLADGAGGWSALTGPTAGYLIGFVVAAAGMGRLARREEAHAAMPRRRARILVGALVGHGVILACGWLGLATRIGGADAWTQGVQPFLWGGVVKSVVLTLVSPAVDRVLHWIDGDAN